MAPLIFCAHAPGKREIERAKAWSSILDLASYYDCVFLPCYADHDYSIGLRNVWDHDGDLIVVEHDVYVLPAMIDELIACPEPRCTWVTWASPIATGLMESILAIRTVDDPAVTRMNCKGEIFQNALLIQIYGSTGEPQQTPAVTAEPRGP